MAASLRNAISRSRQINNLLRLSSRIANYQRSSTFHKQAALQEKWNLMSAVCLERFPLISQEMTPMEKEYAELMQQLEYENSLLSDHELRHKEDLAVAERRKQEDYEETESDAARLQTALEDEDQWEAELRTFTPQDKHTEDDKESMERCLDRKLVLLVKQKLGDQHHWVLPMTTHQAGESMRQTAERSLVAHCGNQLQAKFIGNAPCGFHKYKYNSENNNVVGAKVFFFKAQIGKNDIEKSKVVNGDHLWVTKEEIKDYVNPSYYQSLDKFILEL